MIVQPDGTVDYESFMDSFQKTDGEASRRWLENLLKSDMKNSPPHSSAEYVLPSYNAMEEKLSEMIRAKYSKLSKVCSVIEIEVLAGNRNFIKVRRTKIATIIILNFMFSPSQ